MPEDERFDPAKTYVVAYFVDRKGEPDELMVAKDPETGELTAPSLRRVRRATEAESVEQPHAAIEVYTDGGRELRLVTLKVDGGLALHKTSRPHLLALVGVKEYVEEMSHE